MDKPNSDRQWVIDSNFHGSKPLAHTSSACIPNKPQFAEVSRCLSVDKQMPWGGSDYCV